MYTSQQIAQSVGSYPGGNMYAPQQLPYLYGQTAQPGWRHGDGDPYGYAMGNRLAGTAVGITGHTMLGGLVGGHMMFNAFTKGPWRGIQRAMSNNQGFQVARGAFSQATTMGGRFAAGGRLLGAMGGMTGRVAMGAAFGALPYYLGYKALTGIGSQMYAGARFQQDANRILSRHLNFQDESQSRTGFGLSEREMRGVTSMVRDMTHKDTLRSKDELMRVMDKLGRRDFFQDVSNVNQFKKKFKGMIKTLTHMAKTFGTSLEEAIPLLDSMRRSGIYSSQAQKATALRMRMSGLDPRNASAVMGAAAQMGRASGGHGGAAAQGALETLRTLKFAQGMGGGVGTSISRLMSEMSGGLQGAQARGAVTKQLTSQTLRFLRGPLGRMSLAALANKDFTGLDQGKIEQLLQGRLTTSQLMRMGLNNTASMRNKGRFINREGDLRTAFLKQAGPMAMVGLVQATMRSGIIRGASDEDIRELITRRLAGGNRRTAQLLLNMAKNLPKLRASMNRSDLRQAYQRDYASEFSDTYSLNAIQRRAGNRLYQTFAEPFAQAGQNLYNRITRGWRNMMDDAYGRTNVNITDQAAKAARNYFAGGDKEFRERFGFGPVGQQITYQRRRGGVGQQMFRSVAEWLSGRTVLDTGDKIMASFNTRQLRNMGANIGKPGSAPSDDVMVYTAPNMYGQRAVTMSQVNMAKFLRLEKRRASGARAKEIADKYGTSARARIGMNRAATLIQNKILLDPSAARKYREASPGQKRRMLRQLVRQNLHKGMHAIGDVVTSVAKGEYNGTSPGAVDNAIDDVVATADALLQKKGIGKLGGNVSGGPENFFNLAQSSKEAMNDVFDTIGWRGREMSAGGLVSFLFSGGAGGTNAQNFLKSVKALQSVNDLSKTIMKSVSGIGLTSSEKTMYARLMSHTKGDFTAGGQTMTSGEVEQMQKILANIGKGGGGYAHKEELYRKWHSAIQGKNLSGVVSQVQAFGGIGLKDVDGMTGAPISAIRKMLGSMRGISSRSDLQKVLSGQGLGDVASAFMGMGGKDRTAFLQKLGRSGKAGTAMAAALRAYMQQRGGGKEKLEAATKVLLSRAIGGGSAAAGSKPPTLGNTLELWTGYVKANQKFITAVAAALGDKDQLKNAAARVQAASKPSGRRTSSG